MQNYPKETQKSYNEAPNDHDDTQNNHKQTQGDHIKTQKYYTEMQYDHKKIQNYYKLQRDMKHEKTKKRHEITTRRLKKKKKNPKEKQNEHKTTNHSLDVSFLCWRDGGPFTFLCSGAHWRTVDVKVALEI